MCCLPQLPSGGPADPSAPGPGYTRTMPRRSLSLTPVAPHCGAEVTGLDLSQPLDEGTVVALEHALADRGVLFFRDQELTPEQHKRLGGYFGELHHHPAWPRLVAGHPEIMEIYTDEHSKRIAGEQWHSDVSCDAEPPLGTILRLIEVPPVGGDTLFANMVAAFEALSAPMQRLAEGLTALHDGEQAYRGRYQGTSDEGKVYPRSVHPVVRSHPVIGRKALFVNRIFTLPSSSPPPASSSCRSRRATASCKPCSSTSKSRTSSAASAGARTPSPSGTTAAPCTWPCGTTTRSGAGGTG